MTLDSVIQRIIDNGKKEASQIIEEAKLEKERIIREAKEEGEKVIKNQEEEARRISHRRRIQEIARAELESKKTLLAARKEILDEVYNRALLRLSNLPKNEELLKALLKKNQNEVTHGRVFCSTKDEEMLRRLVGPKFSGTINCKGGFLIESEDGSRRVDCRFESILKDIWEDSIKEIAEMLWR